jgi:hypothetical protein
MPNYAEYFARTGYRATYQIGDRVIGQWNQIPFVGTVGNDRLVSEAVGPEVVVHLDLPVKHQDQFHRILFVKHNQLRKLPEITIKK